MLIFGISFSDFWEMTFKEIVNYSKKVQEKKEADTKEKTYEIYTCAYLSSMFTNRTLNGKQPPSYESIFEANKSNNKYLVTERFKEFVRLHNAKGAKNGRVRN